MFNEEIYQELTANNPSLATTYLSEHSENPEQKKKKTIRKVWPLRLKWFQDKRYDEVKKRFKFLVPILIEIGKPNHRLTYAGSGKLLSGNPFVEKHSVRINGNIRVPVFMKLSCKIKIAEKVKCSVSTIEKYLRGLVRIGALKADNFGKGRSYYSCGYWIGYKNKERVWDHKINKYMNQNIGKGLINDFYIRKP